MCEVHMDINEDRINQLLQFGEEIKKKSGWD